MEAKTIRSKRCAGLLCAAAVIILSGSAIAQDIARIPVRTNVTATITAQNDAGAAVGNTITANANTVDTLRIPMQATSVARSGLHVQNTPAITYARGSVTLNLPDNLAYRTANISVYSLDGRRVMSTTADAVHSAAGISRQSLAAGAYLMSVRGADGSLINSLRLPHSGGKFNINVAFMDDGKSLNLAKAAAAGDIKIIVAPRGAGAANYESRTVTFKPVAGVNPLQIIDLINIAQAVNIDRNTKYVELEGLGGAIAFYNGLLHGSGDADKAQVVRDTLFTGLGLSILRTGNWALKAADPGLTEAQRIEESRRDLRNDSVNVAEARKRVGQNRLRVLVSAWSPPAYLKLNGKQDGCNPPKNAAGRDAPDGWNTLNKRADGSFMYAEYAHWWRKSIEAYNRAGVNPTWITLQNELNFSPCYASMLFDPYENWARDKNLNRLANAGYREALKAVRDTLNKMQNPPKILGPEGISQFWGGFTDYVDNLGDNTLLDGYASHMYDGYLGYGNGDGNRGEQRANWEAFYNKYKDKPHFMTEYAPDDELTEKNMIYFAHILANSLTYGNLSGYVTWSILWEQSGFMVVHNYKSGECRPDWSGAARNICIKPEYHGMRHFSKFLNPGMRRIKMTNMPDQLRGVAYTDARGDSVVTVLVNISENTAAPLTISGVNGYNVSDVVQSIEGDGKPKSAKLSKTVPASLPARSITTIVWTAAPSPGNSSSPIIETEPERAAGHF